MSNNNLRKPTPYRPTKHQQKAFDILEGKGFNRSLIIRKAIDEFMYKEFRELVKFKPISTHPDWA